MNVLMYIVIGVLAIAIIETLRRPKLHRLVARVLGIVLVIRAVYMLPGLLIDVFHHPGDFEKRAAAGLVVGLFCVGAVIAFDSRAWRAWMKLVRPGRSAEDGDEKGDT